MDTGPIRTAVRLESQSLRVELLVEVEAGYHAFFGESPLLDQQRVVEETLPVALATVAPPVLHQILESVAAQLHAAMSDANSLGSSLIVMKKPGTTEVTS